MENLSKLIIFYDEEYIDKAKVDNILAILEKYNKGISNKNDKLYYTNNIDSSRINIIHVRLV